MPTYVDLRRVDSEAALELDRRLREALRDPDIATDVRLGRVAYALDPGQVIGIIQIVVAVADLAHNLWNARRERREALQRIAEQAIPQRPEIREPEVDVRRGAAGAVRVGVVIDAPQGTPVDVTIQVRSQGIRVQVTPLR